MLAGRMKRRARLSRRAAQSLRGNASMSARCANPVSVLPDIRCSGNPADKQTADRALPKSAVRSRLWPVAQRPTQETPTLLWGTPRFPPPLP